MHQSLFVQPELASMVADVLEELATEIDMHYEDDELPGCAPAFVKMTTLANALKSAGFEPPQAYLHILERYERSLN